MGKADISAGKQASKRRQSAVPLVEHRHILGLGALTATLFIALSLIQPTLFFTPANFQSMAFQFPEYAILSLAMMLAMLTGGIDLSVIGTANLSTIIAAIVMTTLFPDGSGSGVLILMSAVFTALIVGTLCGLVNGICIAGIGIPPILATLGTGLMFTGIGVVITGGSAVINFPAAFAVIGNGTIWFVPVPLIIFGVLAIALAFVLNRTTLGVGIYLFGTNELAFRFSGLNSKALILRTYVMCGALSSLGGIVLISRANSAKADYGQSYLLITILIAVLGGTNPYGGFGRVGGLVLAVLSLQFLSSGLNMIQVSNFAKDLVWGLTLLAVMVLSRLDTGGLFTSFKRKRETVQNDNGEKAG